MSIEKREIQCLGRSFHPGMLYDCRSDYLLPAITLWDPDKLKSALNSHPKPYTNCELIAEDTLSEKTSKLGVDAGLKLSLLGGLVSVSGSAHYLNDRKSSTKQERLTLKYSSTSRFDELTMDHLGPDDIQHQQIFEKGDATHVVLAVEYGSDAIFIFDRDVGFDEEQHEVSGELKVAVNLFIGNVEGDAKLTFGEGQNTKYEKIRCKFYGDLELEKNPSNLVQALQVYRDLPSTIKNCGPVPKKAWLYPLTKLDSNAAKLVREISESLINQTEMALEELIKADMKAYDILQSCHPMFENLKCQIESFRRSLTEFKISFQKKLLPILPLIRGGGKEEVELSKLIEDTLKSPFSTDLLQSWLKGKKYEVERLNDYFKQLEDALKTCNVRLTVTPAEAEKLLNNIKYDIAVGFAFNIARKPDPFLDHLQNYVRNNPSSATDSIKPQFLHQDPSVKTNMRQILQAFIKFAAVNCRSEKGKEELVEISEKEKLTKDAEKTQFLVYAEDKDIGKRYARIMLHDLAEGTDVEFMPPCAPGKPSIKQQAVSSELGGNLKMAVNLLIGSIEGDAMVTSVGKSEDVTVRMLPSVDVTWAKPKEGFENVTFFKVQYLVDTGKRVWTESKEYETTNSNPSAIILDLKPQQTYIFRVRSVCLAGVSEFSELSDPIYILPTATNATTVSTPIPAMYNDMKIGTKCNSNGIEARLGMTGKYYCDGPLNTNCVCCNGRCGPSSGCNCASCMILDVEARCLSKGYLVNCEGATARKGITGFFYCGRRVLVGTANCDGYCGPNNGPNCTACKKLDIQAAVRYAECI